MLWSQGFIRKSAWPKLAGIDVTLSTNNKQISIKTSCQKFSEGVSEKRREELEMIEHDLGRSVLKHHLKSFSPQASRNAKGDSFTSSGKIQDPQEHDDNFRDQMEKHMSYLSYVLKYITSQTAVDSSNHMHYYQGYHDVAAIFLLNLSNPHLAATVLAKVSKSHFRDIMNTDFSNVHKMLEIVFFPLIDALDEEVYESLIIAEVDPTVVFPWIISWFSHDVLDLDLSNRLFDLFLVSHPLMPM